MCTKYLQIFFSISHIFQLVLSNCWVMLPLSKKFFLYLRFAGILIQPNITKCYNTNYYLQIKHNATNMIMRRDAWNDCKECAGLSLFSHTRFRFLYFDRISSKFSRHCAKAETFIINKKKSSLHYCSLYHKSLDSFVI